MNKKILLAMSIFLFLIALATLVFALGPAITIISPANNTMLPDSTTSVLVEINTNVSSICKYHTTDENFNYLISGTQFDLTGSTIHNMTWSVSSGNNYTFYYKCNSSSVVNDIASYHRFSVNSTPTTPIIEKICTDSDGGKNYYAKGDTNYLYYENSVLQTNSTSSDVCAGAIINGSFKPNVLREYFCTAQNTTDYEHYDCACSNGACPGADTTAPVISNARNSTYPTNNVNITWDTNENANSAVYYGFTTAYGSTATDANYLTSHSVLLTGLTTGGILYHYKVGSCDNAGNCANSSDYNFTTVTTGGAQAPPINITIKNPLNGSTITESLTWLNVTTTVNAVCKYELISCFSDGFMGTCGPIGYSTMGATNSTSHSQLITGLSNRVGNEWYEISVNCTDTLIDRSNISSIRFNVDIPVFCTDTDNKDYYTKGTAGLLQEHEDYCKSANSLIEYSCDENNTIKDEDYFIVMLANGSDVQLQYKYYDSASKEAQIKNLEDLSSLTLSVASNGTFNLNLYGKTFYFRVLDTTVSDSDIQLTDGPMVLGEKVSCPYGCENGACKTCTWPSVGDWVIGENEVVECNNKNITLTSIEYEVTVSSLTGTEAVFIVNGETTGTLGNGETYVLSDGSNIQVNIIRTDKSPIGVEYCINSYLMGGVCSLSPAGETETFSFGGNLYVDSNANFTLNNSILNADNINLLGNSNNILENSKIYSRAGFSGFSVNRIYNVEFNKNVWFDGDSINIIDDTEFNKSVWFGGNAISTLENSLFNNSEESINYWWNSTNTIKNSTFYGYSAFNEHTVNNIENSEFYSWMVFTDSSVNNIDFSLFCEGIDFRADSINNISNSEFGLNCPKWVFTYTDKETGEEVIKEMERWVSVQFSGNSTNNISSSVFNNSDLSFREEPKVDIIDSTIYGGLSLSTQTNDNMTIENINPGIVNTAISSGISQFELALTNTQIGGANVYGERNSTTSIINSILDYANFGEGSTSLIKDSTINATYFDHNTSNTIENSSFDNLVVYENSATSISDSTTGFILIRSTINDLTITGLKPGNINTNIGLIAITNTNISDFFILLTGDTVNSILDSDILGLVTGNSYFTDFGESSLITTTTIENSDIGFFLTGGNAINKAYNSTFNSTRYADMYSIVSDSNNTIENSNFYGKIALVDNASFNFANSTVENIYWVGSEYKRCYSEGPIAVPEDGSEPVIDDICVSWEYLTIKGNLNITNKTISSFYGNTSLTRHYPIYIDAIGPANNKLVSIKDNGNLIWSGTTGSTGYAEAVLVFDNSTYNDVYNIVIDNVIIDNISLTKDTPIKYTIPVIYNLLNSSITDTSATISWNTNKLINSKLYYGLTKAYENSITNETLSASRSFDISGLLPNMLYQYKAESCDEVDYCAVSYGNFITSEPVDNTAPVISNIAVSSITTSSAAISWDTTDEGATAQLEYGATTAYGKNTTFDARLLTSHSFNLTGLNYNTQYYYKISSYDGVGNLATAESSFTTLNDATAPVISNVQAKEIYEDGAYLYAETNEESWYDPDWAESNVLIDYGENDSYGRTSIAGEISHSEGVWRYGMIYHVNYFEPNETYHYRFAAKDRAGNVAYSADYTFTTSYTEPPVNETAVCLYNGNCWINEQCYDSSATNPENYLQYCDSNKTQAAWSYKAPQFDSVTAWLGDTAGTQPIFYVIVDASQPVSIRGTATPIPGDTRTLFFSPLNITTNMYSTNAVVGANRDVSYKLSITNAGGETAEFSGLVESTKPNLIVSQSDNRRGDNSKFKNQTVYIPDNKTVELPLNNTHNSRLLLKTDSEILKKAEVIDIFPINNPSAYAGLPADNKLDSFEINMTFDNSTTNLTYCVSYAGFSSIDEDSIKAYKLVGSSWNEISSTKDTAAKEICAVIKSAQTPYLFAGNPTSSSPSGRGGSSSGGGDGSPAATPAPATKPKPVPTPLVKEALSEEKTKEETISLFGEGKRPSLKERISKITGAVTGFDGPISSIGYIAMLSVVIVGLGAYTFYDRKRCYYSK